MTVLKTVGIRGILKNARYSYRDRRRGYGTMDRAAKVRRVRFLIDREEVLMQQEDRSVGEVLDVRRGKANFEEELQSFLSIEEI